MNEYIIDYTHKGEVVTAYVHAYSFEDARERLECIRQTGSINWVLQERVPVIDRDALDYIEAFEEMKTAVRKMRKITGGK